MPTRRALVIDDDVIAGRFLGDWLGARGWQVTWARSLAAARAELARSSFAVVLLDRHLPDGDGVHWLADAGLAASIRCMVTSGGRIDAGSLPPGVEALRKPLDVERLQAWLAPADTAAAAEVDTAADHDRPAPVLDDATALARFGGNRDALRALRSMLLGELVDSVPWRRQLRCVPAPAAAIDALHRLRAACALTGCARLGLVSERLESGLRGGAPTPPQWLDDLDAAVAATMAAISGEADCRDSR